MGRRTQKLRAGRLRQSSLAATISRLEDASRVDEPVQIDNVNHPSHYNMGGIEVIDAIEAWGLGFHLGNTVKYVARAEHKGKKLEDLKKARWYLDREIERLEKL